ncbi:MAG: xanthine dehydrogenase family protein subunit M, partial [Acidimicrobiia bacterium]|nr:xanthine dehydrogenase family protein subunit M [Acidimicrobiia bacterium]
GDRGGGLRLGGMTRQRAVEQSAVVAREAPLLAAAMPFIAHAAIRTRGTVAGSLAHADPAAELPAVVLALDATLTVRSAAGERTLPAASFFTGLFSTALRPDELLVGIAIPPLPRRTGCAFQEISRRRGDFALAGAAAAVTLDEDGRCAAVRVALFGVGDRAVLADNAARALTGHTPSSGAIREAAAAAARHDIDPPSDIHASSRYRRHLAEVLIRRVLERSVQSVEAA